MRWIRQNRLFNRLLAAAFTLLLANVIALSCALAAELCVTDCPDSSPVSCIETCADSQSVAADTGADGQLKFKSETSLFPATVSVAKLSISGQAPSCAQSHFLLHVKSPPLKLRFCVFQI